MSGHRFYQDLAPWWPLISPASDYAEEAAFAATLLRDSDSGGRQARGDGQASGNHRAGGNHQASDDGRPSDARQAGNDRRPSDDNTRPTVLELGSGGGHNAVHLKAHFALTLVDLEPAMLAESKKINPELPHLQGDMRTLRLDDQFDAVFVHDAIEYMTTEADLRRAIETAFVHTKPGGRALFVPDATKETFEPETDHGGIDAPDGRGARYLSWSYDPDPHDTTTLTAYAFLLRDTDGRTTAVNETHETGLFRTAMWLKLLREKGFVAEAVTEETSEGRPPRTLFVGRKISPDGR
ncbi:hypothetical protein Ais01nite_47910 [Asanoa ishikariensis]|uniref:Methyltransferase domain-containing protein n=1 Tax=Asanoa ishikariensis TaxID=137265 RepID=A0A1H3RWD1_9ACTN|nr:class I SAM-dependent methyltransferase [Asanoa ishikariensis]GIF66756.1 hypothetical protein Ais01nite_47910 [Asanoa ishikariensis]SDZ29937.1 Methyltransferase domain-containing protein [Asanoa ishikariensis]